MEERKQSSGRSRQPQEKKRRKEAKQARLKNALRANLRRRKQTAAINKPNSSDQ